ncbi:MAG TPA: tetratricopeptide repeat protein, partial [Phycisphaerae bacterium]|nr:tetratricopeptide repeat protein [Phycisphaerae bacterium]
MTVDQAFQAALQHHQAGNLEAARGLYEQILAVVPGHGETLHLLGVMATQKGEYDRAVELIGRAIALEPAPPRAAHYRNNLGEAHRRAGRGEEAVGWFKKALAIQETYPDAYTNLGLALMELGRAVEALGAFERAVQLRPEHSAGYSNLGDALAKLGRVVEAKRAYERALALNPRSAAALNNLANFCSQEGRVEEAQKLYGRAVEAEPTDVVALTNFGALLMRVRNFGASRQLYEHFVRVHPKNVEALSGLGHVLRETTRMEEAAAMYRRAIAVSPKDPYLHVNLATALRDGGFHEEARAAFAEALRLGRDEPAILSAWILTLYVLRGATQAEVDGQKRLWDERFAAPLYGVKAEYRQARDAERKLRVGYVSPDLRVHPVGRFMLPLIRAHDRAAVQVTCYATSPAADAYTAEIRAAVEAGGGRWRMCEMMGDDQLAVQVREDEIDVLVDLSMHAVGNRLLMFARRPAPVQVSYLAYADGTGLRAMAGHLTDDVLEPVREGEADAGGADRAVRLPRTYWCYAPHAGAPEVGELPALRAGHVTFGCLNHFAKITGETVRVWAEVLKRVAGSRLLLHVPPGNSRELMVGRFGEAGVEAGRLEFMPTMSLEGYLAVHQRIDVALDPFPYVGGTTTCDALWMGVPVVTLAGGAEMPGTSRGGWSILRVLGRERWVARRAEEYVEIAAGLAGDLAGLAEERRTLRE